jgi:HAD superfamily hydrolase (TIGR01490 family)
MRRFAFFDLDETLIRYKSALGCHAVYAAHCGRQLVSSDDWRWGRPDVREWLQAGVSQGRDRDTLNRSFYQRYFAGVAVADMETAAGVWYVGLRPLGLYRDSVLAALTLCRARGYEIVIVSGSFKEVVANVALDLGIQHTLCAPLTEQDGRYTGTLDSAPMIGRGKQRAVADFLDARDADLEHCLGFGDDISDLPFLTYLGRAYVCAHDGTVAPQWVGQQGLALLADFE